MHVHVYERIVLGLTGVLLVVALGAIASSVTISHVHLPGPVGRVDPRTLRTTPPFDQPGVREIGPGRYEAVMLVQAWSYTPSEVRVPAGSTVTFRVASADVTHGFMIERTNVNLTVIPGYVAEATATFREPGTYLLICHEYCGAGHQAMFGRVVVQ